MYEFVAQQSLISKIHPEHTWMSIPLKFDSLGDFFSLAAHTAAHRTFCSSEWLVYNPCHLAPIFSSLLCPFWVTSRNSQSSLTLIHLSELPLRQTWDPPGD